jgi:hypothetical protein
MEALSRGVRKSKNSLHCQQPRLNTLQLVRLLVRPSGFVVLLAKFLRPLLRRQLCTVTINLRSHLPKVEDFTRAPNTLIFVIILFDSSSKRDTFAFSTALLTTWPPTFLPKHYLMSRRNISRRSSVYRFDGGVLDNQTPSDHVQRPYVHGAAECIMLVIYSSFLIYSTPLHIRMDT